MGRSAFGITSRSIRNFLSHTTSFSALDEATYSASVVESATHVCLTLLQQMTPPLKVKTYSDVDFLESMSLWKSESI